MNKIFIFYHKHLSEKAIEVRQKALLKSVKSEGQKKRIMKTAPSEFSLNLILGYAAALQVIRISKEISFDIVKN